MTIPRRVVRTARAVRLAAAFVAASIVVGFVALSSFSSRYGSTDGPVVRTVNTALAAAVLQQETAGRVCTATPVLTDVVLFEPIGVPEVKILTFEEAIRAAGDRQGSIRRYCVTP